MWSRCMHVVCILFVILLFGAQLSTKSTPVCPVRPLADESGPQGDCQCSVLDEIQCRGLSDVPKIDVKAAYLDRQTYRSFYLARQHIRHLLAVAFAALNVRRIVLDFNPLGDRIDPRAFRGTVDAAELARLGLVSRRRRTPYHTLSQPLAASQSQLFNVTARNYDDSKLELTADGLKRKYTGNRCRHKQTASRRAWNCNSSVTYDETESGQAVVVVADRSRR